ncbi:hypothetical protein QJS04_geneDACA016361 [Acorus gramineus]|uniref:Uncharacterized protein n=1 Tax=Acorus gramineus TaxID=55184 RepID=A0AAV9AU05_ACOGR|nr:hypothetical protein QJS04_geneDACA016361 [Acorus gramineus]
MISDLWGNISKIHGGHRLRFMSISSIHGYVIDSRGVCLGFIEEYVSDSWYQIHEKYNLEFRGMSRIQRFSDSWGEYVSDSCV